MMLNKTIVLLLAKVQTATLITPFCVNELNKSLKMLPV